MRISISLGLVPQEDPLFTEGGTVEPTRLTRQTLIGMHITRDFPRPGIRFIGEDGQLFVLADLTDELPEVLPEPAGGDADNDDVDADGGHAHPPPPLPQPPQSQPQGVPQYPQHVLYD
ncbi:hypothetical protein Hanom_Chr17g01545231 [Helianthus anomalus]